MVKTASNTLIKMIFTNYFDWIAIPYLLINLILSKFCLSYGKRPPSN